MSCPMFRVAAGITSRAVTVARTALSSLVAPWGGLRALPARATQRSSLYGNTTKSSRSLRIRSWRLASGMMLTWTAPLT